MIMYVTAGGVFKVKSEALGTTITYPNADQALSAGFASGDATMLEIREGNYPFVTTSGTYQNVRINQHIRMSKGARLQVPNGFTGAVFSFNNTGAGRFASLEGGIIEELGTPARNWTAIELKSTTAAGTSYNHIHNVDIYDPGTAIKLLCDGSTSFVNANTISNMNINGATIFIDFQLANSGTSINVNNFYDIRGQCKSNVTNGAKNVTGKYNTFDHCYFYDMSLNGAAVSMSILSSAQSTLIKGGFVDHQNYSDSGVGTIRIDGDLGINGMELPVLKNNSYHDLKAIAAPSSPATGIVRKYTKTIDSNNDGLFYKARINGAVVEVQI